MPAVAPDPAFAQAGEIEALFDEGMDSYLRGDFVAAKDAFEKAFGQKPSSDIIARWLEQAKINMVVRMARDKDPQLSGVAAALLRGARPHRAQMKSDAALIQRRVDEVVSADGERQVELMVRASNDFGRNVVPALVPLLADAEIGRRGLAFSWIAQHIGLDAVPVLTAAWKHPNEVVRAGIAKLLGARSLRHEYSMAYLKAMADSDSDAEVRNAAKESLEAIVAGGAAPGAAEAKEMFLRNAEKLYREPHLSPFDRTSYSSSIFELEGERLVEVKLARFQVPERLAMRNLEEALTIDPSYRAAHVLNLLNDCAQVVGFDRNSEWYAAQEGQAEVTQTLVAQKPWFDSVARLRTLAAPASICAEALAQANQDGRSEVTRYLIERMRERKLHGDVPASLVAALEDRSSRLVRITAAIAIAEMNPQSGFDAGEQVVSILESAVLGSGIRTVVRAMGSQENANRFESIISDLQMESYVHVKTTSAAYEAVTRMPPDLVLVDEDLARDIGGRGVEPVNVFINQMRRDYRTAGVPIVVVVPQRRLDAAKSLYADDEKKVWVVPSSVDPLRLKKTVIDPMFTGKDDAKSLATHLAAEASQALAHLAELENPLFPLDKSADALALALARREDEVRIPCIRAAGALGRKASGALEELAQVAADADSSIEAREESLMAIGRICSDTRATPGEDVMKILFDLARSDDLRLRKASWMAVADAQAKPQDVLTLVTTSTAASAAGEEGATEATPDAEATEAADEPEADAEAAAEDDAESTEAADEETEEEPAATDEAEEAEEGSDE